MFGSLQAGNVFTFTPDTSSARQAANELIRLLDRKPQLETRVLYKATPASTLHVIHPISAEADSTKERESNQGPSQEAATPEVQPIQGRVQFDNVHFNYPTRPHIRVLQGMNLEIEARTSCAFVSPSGCGKSTMIQLIERFYTPTGGRILLDRKDIAGMEPCKFRRHIALVSQEPSLFEGSITFNIAAGLVDDAEEWSEPQGQSFSANVMAKIQDAAEQANVLSFIDLLPDGFDTTVGHSGTQLSGGQKQHITLAQALIRNPRILLLDEATSALNVQSKQLVQAALDKAATEKGRTTISIAHRLASVVRADKIFFLANGVVKASGTHQELPASNCDYANLVAMQSLSEGKQT